jgi:SsrA-binding protein
MKNKKKKETFLLKNKKAYHDFFILETYEAGIELTGTEIKSVRERNVNFKDSYVKIINGEAFLFNLHIAKYKNSKYFNHDPLRKRRLLLHKKEIRKLYSKVQERGYTIVPLKLYFKRGFLKVEIGLAKGKHLYDKREDIKKKEMRKWEKSFY